MNRLSLQKTEKKVTEDVYILIVYGQHYVLHKTILIRMQKNGDIIM